MSVRSLSIFAVEILLFACDVIFHRNFVSAQSGNDDFASISCTPCNYRVVRKK